MLLHRHINFIDTINKQKHNIFILEITNPKVKKSTPPNNLYTIYPIMSRVAVPLSDLARTITLLYYIPCNWFRMYTKNGCPLKIPHISMPRGNDSDSFSSPFLFLRVTRNISRKRSWSLWIRTGKKLTKSNKRS